MKKMILALCLLSGCVTGSDEASRTLVNSGFTSIQPGGLDLFACSDDDKTGRKFTAKNPQGILVRGTVCCGVFKSCTVRF